MKRQPFLAHEHRHIALLKKIVLLCMPVLLGMLVVTGCKENNSNIPADNDPIFQQDPQLKSATEEIKKSPKDANVYAERARLLRRMRQDSLAVRDYKSAIMLDSSKAEYYSAIGDILFEAKDLTGSIDWIQKAIKKNPNDRSAHLKVAKMLLYLGQHAKAFAEINIVLREDAHNPEAYFLKGMLYKDMKDTAKSISSFLTAIESDPTYKDAVVQLGLLYSAQKNPIAIQYLENAFKFDTTDVSPIFAMGVHFQNMNDYAKAKEYYRQCIIRDWQFADAYFNMGYVLVQEDSVAKAFRQYDMAAKIDPRNPAAFFNRGLCREMLDSIPQAVKDYQLALSLDPTYNSPKEALARLKRK